MTAATQNRQQPPEAKGLITPQRSNGRKRVELILQAASDIVQERGYEATTMREIALRSGTNIGSLYRFFPTKDHVANALIEEYARSSESRWRAVISAAQDLTPEKLGDRMLDAFLASPKTGPALLTYLESRADAPRRREEFRLQHLEWIGEALKANAPHLKTPTLNNVAVVVLYQICAMATMTSDSASPNPPGAPQEMRASIRIYLASRLSPRKTET